ncbi:excisionase [Bacillus sp. FJAT-18017]|uniref:substrate-binding domain-containing protein n=1 Tax=Bacillus sp. FJAT-18017 TaxID=1705566 RepID=UPI0006BC45B0|nr:helix-turn-helix transcriptional regulator [Bacillus sp. FJAT-18017]ALC89047.1 excisionase [Bacillus sp. FJAT-18017]
MKLLISGRQITYPKEASSVEIKAYTPDEVAQIFQISKHTVYELIKRGELQAFKIGNKMRIEHDEIERYKESMKAPARKPVQETTRPAVTQHIQTRLAGSHDFLVEHLVKEASTTLGVQVQPTYIGSLEGLMMLYRGQADIAAMHLLDPMSHEYNLPFIHQLFVYETISVMRFAAREQGFIVAKGNPKEIKDFGDLTRKDIKFINRQKGSGTRFLLDSKLMAAGISPSDINGYDTEEWTHLSTASHIARGSADVAFGIRSAASHLGLDFIPVAKEQFDLVFRWTGENRETLAKLVAFLQSEEFKNSLSNLEGYDIAELGSIVFQTKQQEESINA